MRDKVTVFVVLQRESDEVRSRAVHNHTSQVDVQLNSTMRLISGTLHSTLLPWLQCSPTLTASPMKEGCH